jgi:hypothetical protein
MAETTEQEGVRAAAKDVAETLSVGRAAGASQVPGSDVYE